MGAGQSRRVKNNVTCPCCQAISTHDLALVQHLNNDHPEYGAAPISTLEAPQGSGFASGDEVLAMWDSAKWQYFPAVVVKQRQSDGRYEINWHDGDTTGRFVESCNIYLNVIPNPLHIQVGSRILFKQGSYSAGASQETGGYRWHEGVITSVDRENGVYSYHGHHTKGKSDGKGLSYGGYQYYFANFSSEDLRLSLQVQSVTGAIKTSNALCSVSGNVNVHKRKHIDLSLKHRIEVGDHVISEWKRKGRYFSATVKKILPNSKYLVAWNDGDAEQEVKHYELNLDSLPKHDELVVDSLVFFQHGATEWHLGLITNLCTRTNGTVFYDGEPLSREHAQSFESFTIEQLCSKIEIDSTGSLSIPTSLSPSYSAPVVGSSLINVGDSVLAMWVKTKWQYFPATISKILPNLMYKIDWDDGDTTGRVVNCFEIAKDMIPLSHQVGVGTIVLFPQGGYKCGDTQLYGGTRWHQGVITNIRVNEYGLTQYDGCHTKNIEDGKWVTYKGYSEYFYGMLLEDLRVGPNMFDIISNQFPPPNASAPAYDDQHKPPPIYEDVLEGDNPSAPPVLDLLDGQTSPPALEPAPPYSPPSMSGGDEVGRLLRSIDPTVCIIERNVSRIENSPQNQVDVLISYCWINSSIASEKQQIDVFQGTSFSDPRRIANNISKKTNLKVWVDVDCVTNGTQSILEQHAEAIKKCRVFVPCVSDQYAASIFCRMQFQYASGIPEKKVVPIIVGTGDQWKTSVIGLAMQKNKEKYEPINLQSADSDSGFEKLLNQIISRL